MTDYLLGTIEIKAYEYRALNFLADSDIQCSRINKGDECIIFRIPLLKISLARKVLNNAGIMYEIGELFGFPAVINRYKKRVGLFIGLFIFSILVSLSQTVIWSFDISGNCKVDDRVILETLEKLGCKVGSRINNIDFDVLNNKFLMECSDIAWISVNMDGTKANVEVREVSGDKSGDGERYNIVASESGQIELITVVSGKEQILIGDIVKKGDILISGVETYREGENTFYNSADGSIIAKVNRFFEIEIPSEIEKKTYTDNFKIRKSIDFFSFRINLFRNSGIPYDKYDIITENRQIVLFNCIELPIWISTEKICEYKSEAVSLDENELRSIAVKNYRDKLANMAKECELVSIKSKHSFEDGVYRIECNLYCLTDIAEKIPYTIVDEGQEDK